MSLTDREYRKQFYNALNYLQSGRGMSEVDEYDQYYVPVYADPDGPAGPDLVAEMLNAIDFTMGGSVQILSGYRGAGKTTELMRLQKQIDRTRYVPVYMDVEDYFNPEIPIEEGAFLAGLAAGFVQNFDEDHSVKQKLWQKVIGFFERIDVSVEANAHLKVGPADLDMREMLRDDDSFRTKVKNVLQSNRAVFRKEMHAFFEDVVQNMPGERVPVFIVDSVDHYRGSSSAFPQVRESVELLFSTYAAGLALPGMHVIYTVPIYARPIGVSGQVWPVLNVKVKEKDGEVCREGVGLLRQVLEKRAPGNDLSRVLGEDDLERIILGSGGLFRDLFRMVMALLLKNGELPFDRSQVDAVIRKQRSEASAGLSEEQWEILSEVRATHKFHPKRELEAEAWDLQALGSVLCYRNGEVDWYGVHPLLEPLIEARSPQSQHG